MKFLLFLTFLSLAYCDFQSDIVNNAGLDGSTGVVQNLNNLDFKTILGGPLTAAIEAQSKSAATTLDFIRGVAFRVDNATGNQVLQTLDFVYDEFDNGSQVGTFKMSVPLLTLVSVPTLDIEEVEIEFNAAISSVRRATSQDEFDYASDSSYQQYSGASQGTYVRSGTWSGYWGAASYTRSQFTGKFTAQSKNSATGENQEKYTMNVRLKAGQAAPPAGVTEVLDNLERLIRRRDPVQ